jgi:hypothetical protein
VRIQRGPATVTGDVCCIQPLEHGSGKAQRRRPEPGARRPTPGVPPQSFGGRTGGLRAGSRAHPRGSLVLLRAANRPPTRTQPSAVNGHARRALHGAAPRSRRAHRRRDDARVCLRRRGRNRRTRTMLPMMPCTRSVAVGAPARLHGHALRRAHARGARRARHRATPRRSRRRFRHRVRGIELVGPGPERGRRARARGGRARARHGRPRRLQHAERARIDVGAGARVPRRRAAERTGHGRGEPRRRGARAPRAHRDLPRERSRSRSAAPRSAVPCI